LGCGVESGSDVVHICRKSWFSVVVADSWLDALNGTASPTTMLNAAL
jgi:hypothetical protein